MRGPKRSVKAIPQIPTTMTSDAQRYILSRCREDNTSGCWLWVKSVGSHGYGNACINGRAGTAHRYAFEAFKGNIPDGFEVDHLCKNRRCVNPEHLEAVPKALNIRRQHSGSEDLALCPRGHDRSFTTKDKRGWPVCSKCKAEAQRRYRASKKSIQPDRGMGAT